MPQIRLTREELHEMVWTTAVWRVAPGLGISDVALRKRCRALHVPLPDARYWGRLHAGRPVQRVPLPPAPAGVPHSTTFDPRRRRRAATEEALAGEGSIVPAVVPAKRDRRVAATLAALRQAKQDDNGGVKSGGRGLFAVRAHPDTLARVSEFLDLLVATAQANGFALEDTASGLALRVDGETVRLSLSQVIRRTRHQPTPEELARRERWDRRHRGDWNAWEGRPVVPYYDFTPTGLMALEVGSWPRPASVTARFADSARRKIEERVPEILSSARAHAACQVEWWKEREAERASADEARARRQREEEEARSEQQRAKFLGDLLERKREHGELAALLATVRGEEASPFAAWARRRLALLAGTLEWPAVEAEAARLGL